MADWDPELGRFLKVEGQAFERYDRPAAVRATFRMWR
jgi:hypothetical protein